MNVATQIAAKILHASRVEQECAYRDHQYATREWLPGERVPFLRGAGAHKGRETALKHFLERGSLPPLHDAQGAAEAEIEERIEKSPDLAPEDVEGARDAAVALVEADYLLALPEIAPHVLAVEEEVVVPIGETSWSLSGRFDARGKDPLTGRGTILDLKTSERSPVAPHLTAALSSQLTFYAILHNHRFGNVPSFALDYLWLMEKGPKKDTIERDALKVATLSTGLIAVRRRVVTHRSAGDLAAGMNRLRFRIDAEEAGWHPPASSGFLGACQRCSHFGHDDASMRCPFVPETRPTEATTSRTSTKEIEA